jgi:hypothetical protein
MADYNLPKKSGAGHDWYKQNPDSSSRDVTIPVTNFEKSVRETFRELESLLLSKHKDYGPLNISASPGGAVNGLRVRMHDKLARINNLYDKNESTPQHEPLEDSFKDMANYAIIGLLVLRGQWNK